VPCAGAAATAAERKLLVAPLWNWVPHALPLVDTPVVDTDSFWDRWNVERMMRQSAVAAAAVPAKAISARNPVLSIMSPPVEMRDATETASGRALDDTQPSVAFNPLTRC
jgi:hypothetical protein